MHQGTMYKKINRVIGYYSVFLGIAVLSMWVFILSTGTVPEGKGELVFHLISEGIMACLCIGAGWIILKKENPRFTIAAHAMVVYSVLNAAGYYLGKGEFLMTVFFVVLFVISLGILVFHFGLGK